MARAEALRLGPFVGGLNTASDPTAVADSELVVCNNLELDIDGSLVSRPPIVETVHRGSWTERIVIIGRGTFAGSNYLIGSNADGTFAFDGTTWTFIKASLQSDVALQYGGYMWIVPKPGTSAANPGGRWDPVGGFVADTNMPEGQAAMFHKSRMFICPGPDATTNESRLRFTEPIASSTLNWLSTDLIDVSPGDGQQLIDIDVYNDDIMLFKNDSTYVLAYDIKPTDAILRNINSTLGVTDIRCKVSYENSIFVFHEGNVYEIVNYDFSRVNLKVPFTLDGTVPTGKTRAEQVFMSLLGDRLLVRYFNTVYVFGLKTRTWCTWSSVNTALHNFGPLVSFPTDAVNAVNTKYYAGSAIKEYVSVVYIQDGYDATTKEQSSGGNFYDISCKITTKNFDMADSHHFKRLMWWGADVLTTRDVIGEVVPIMLNFQVLWSQLTSNLWADLTGNTWAYPLGSAAKFDTGVSNSSAGGRLFVKFLKSLRFREIQFTVVLKNDGSTSQGPCRLFTLTAIVGSKQTVSKQVN